MDGLCSEWECRADMWETGVSKGASWMSESPACLRPRVKQARRRWRLHMWQNSCICGSMHDEVCGQAARHLCIVVFRR